jgi:superfamily I DNA/RNA helicase
VPRSSAPPPPRKQSVTLEPTDTFPQWWGRPGHVRRGSPTTFTTLEGAKGLQAEHVFVVGMNEKHFPRSNKAPTDHEVCCMIVALTRATKCCHLVSCQRFGREQLNASVFIGWLGDLVRPVVVDKDYFTSESLRDT